MRISAAAFGSRLSRRDLFLSPDHAVQVDEVLIPARYLTNGHGIAQVGEATYSHIESPRHDVLAAEGLPTEFYLDTGDRSNFSNGGGPVRLHPDFSECMWEAMGCAPLLISP